MTFISTDVAAGNLIVQTAEKDSGDTSSSIQLLGEVP